MTDKRLLETSHPPLYYLPPEAVREGVLLPTDRTKVCERKGVARFFPVMVDDFTSENASWAYGRPTAAFEAIRDHIAIGTHLRNACYADGKRVQAELGGFYGGWITKNTVGPFIGVPGTLGLIGQRLSYSAEFSDTGDELHTATFHRVDGIFESALVDEITGAGIVFGEHQYAEPVTYTIRIDLQDEFANLTSVEQQITVHAVLLEDDTDNPDRKILTIGGTPKKDRIEFRSKDHGSAIEVKLNGKQIGTFATDELSRLIVYAGDGNDKTAGTSSLKRRVTNDPGE